MTPMRFEKKSSDQGKINLKVFMIFREKTKLVLFETELGSKFEGLNNIDSVMIEKNPLFSIFFLNKEPK